MASRSGIFENRGDGQREKERTNANSSGSEEMLENPSTETAAPPGPTVSAVKRYAPPNLRNRPVNRRKSGDRFDRTNYANDGEKAQQYGTSRNIHLDHSDVVNENSRLHFVALEGCSRSEASQLLNDRWATVMHNYNDMSIDLSERPVMYSGSGASAWGQIRLPHQFMSPGNNNIGAPTDFLSELCRAMRNANVSSDN
ncbi:hypothetical protein K2173_018301 [Erythroxylum novogranatense]|uniref:Uncharacterized protein n=1 Tax=Erythroxylum novogranatense TaxID=1862640 RepID=A0AAV8UDE8_9ROSI|nr:hypothetical protein K2173_018301 [Erythroxylum novogranatense]